MLTSLGLEVEGIEEGLPSFEGVVAAKIVATEKHPNADKLQVAQVFDGTKEYSVVCGAPNCRPGIKVPFAPVGAKVGGKAIRAAELRGVPSSGMLCSAKELGLSDENEGLLEFDDRIREGADVAELWADTVFDISLTPNLAHVASVRGVARELSASLNLPVKTPFSFAEPKLGALDKISIEVAARNKCPRYSAIAIYDVPMGPSPDWMQKSLIQVGIRPINGVVDVTNFVQIELGHPLHAFDLDRVEDKKLVVRNAADGEKFLGLDGKERILSKEDLVIAGKSRIEALAGIMGGEGSEVRGSTRNILLEAAVFDPVSVRRSAKRHKTDTESSKRFERGVDPNGTLQALMRARDLITSILGGKASEVIFDLKEERFIPKVIPCRLSRISALLGAPFSQGEVESLFLSLQMEVQWDGKDLFQVRVPTYRRDLSEEIDLIEEVARLFGYDRFDKTRRDFKRVDFPSSPLFLFERRVKQAALSLGLQELITCDLIGPHLLKIVGAPLMPKTSQIEVLNPTSIEQSILRTSLLPGMLGVVKTNCNQQIHTVRAFEIGRIHFKWEEGYREELMLAMCLAGKRNRAHFSHKGEEVDFYDLKGMVEELFSALNISRVSFRKSENVHFHPGRQAAIFLNEQEVGKMGEIHPSIQTRLDVPERLLFAEIDLGALMFHLGESPKMQPLALYPSVSRDWTVALGPRVEAGRLLDDLRKAGSKLLESVELIDLFAKDKERHITFRFVYRDLKKTVSSEEVDVEHQNLINSAMKLTLGEEV